MKYYAISVEDESTYGPYDKPGDIYDDDIGTPYIVVVVWDDGRSAFVGWFNQ